MATTVAILEAQLRADTRDFDRGVNRSEGRWKKFGGVLKKGALAAAAGVGALGVMSVRNASNLEESLNKATVTFRGSERNVIKWSETMAASFGISQAGALEAAGSIGAMLVPMEFSRKEASKMSMTMVELAGDMASFNNEDPTEMLDRIRAGLSGESEPLKRFGSVLSETRVKQHAWNIGLAETGKQLTEQQKVQARYSLLLKDTADQQGDMGRTSGSLANQQKILRAQFEDVTAKLGQKLLPMVVKVMGVLLRFITWLDGVNGAQRISKAWDRVVKTFKNGWQAITDFFFDAKIKILTTFLDMALKMLRLADKAFGWLPGLGPKIDKAIRKIEEMRDVARLAAARRYAIRFVTNAAKVKSQIEDFRSSLPTAGGDFAVINVGGAMNASNIIGLGKQLQSMGFAVGEHPAFGGVGRHAENSYHYRGRALDINADSHPWGEARALDWLHARLLPLYRSGRLKELLWRTAGHYDHLHLAMAKGGIFTKPWTGMMSVAERGKPEGFVPLPASGSLGGDVNLYLNVGNWFGSDRESARKLAEFLRPHLDRAVRMSTGHA